MYIHEAIKEAMPQGKSIRRRNEYWITMRTRLIPTATTECMIVCGKFNNITPRWNPDAEDLMADDWEVLPG